VITNPADAVWTATSAATAATADFMNRLMRSLLLPSQRLAAFFFANLNVVLSNCDYDAPSVEFCQ
jgi:hypothetical protein